MTRLSSFFVLLIVVACDSRDERRFGPSQPTGVSEPAPNPTPVPPSSVNGVIQVGEDLKATFSGPWQFYELTAPSDGTLVLRLIWNPATNLKLMVAVGDMEFNPSPPGWSPVVGRVPVAAGQTYLLRIDQAFAPWDYDFSITPFVLTTALE